MFTNLSCSDLENEVTQRKEGGNSMSEGNEVRYHSS